MTQTVYLLHFSRPFRHASHYAGYTTLESPEERLARHVAGRGAVLVRAAVAAGIAITLARTWAPAPRKFERRVKGRGMAALCPVCSGPAAYRRLPL